MRRYRRVWRAMLIALVGAGALSGCYYDPYTGYWYPSPPYYAYPMAYPYGPGYPYPPGPNPAQGYPPGPGPNPAQGYPPGPGPNPAQGYAPGTPPPLNAPVQQEPLPPRS